MNVLILGSRAREHALVWKIAQSPLVKQVFIAPGNAGTAQVGKNVELNPSDHVAVVDFCRKQNIELVVVGSDSYLAEGIIDALNIAGILAFGPTKAAAEIEWSKKFAKELMEKEGIPTAQSRSFTQFDVAVEYAKQHALPVVIKASGLADGKGVAIAQTHNDAVEALHQMMVDRVFGESGAEVVIEEFLVGNEISIHALCAGEDAILFPSAQDHKRAFDGDRGPNTGGMGVIAPVPNVSSEQMLEIRDQVVLPALRELKKRGRPFYGILYPSVMLTDDGPKVIEYNARLGDPETESYMRLLESDFVPALLAVARGSIKGIELKWHTGAAACVMIVSGGYPGTYEKNFPISGIDEAEKAGAVVFHAGTSNGADGTLVTNGGRVIGVTAIGTSLRDALTNAYLAVSLVQFKNARYRKDIGARVLGGSRI